MPIGLLTVSPTPVRSRFVVLGISNDGGEAIACQGIRHIALGDVLLKPREDLLEEAGAVAEQFGFGDAAGVHRGEGDAGALVVAFVQFAHGQHVAEFAVLVGFARFEFFAADHRDRSFEAIGHALEVAQIRGRRNGDFAAEFLGVGGDGAEDDEAGFGVAAVLRAGFEVFEHQITEQEVAQVVGGDAQFVAVGAIHRLLEEGHVGGGVADEGIEGAAQGAVVGDELADAGEAGEVKVEDLVGVGGHVEALGGGDRFGAVAAGHDDEPAFLTEGAGGFEADACGCSGDDCGGGHVVNTSVVLLSIF